MAQTRKSGRDGRAPKAGTRRPGAARGAKPKEPASTQRRKDQRPEEIVAAAFEEFADKGFAGTRLEDVAARARVSKGLPYLYFKTKEELFKAVIKALIQPRFEALFEQIRSTPLPPEDFLRGPFLTFLQEFVVSRKAAVARLMIAEGPKHPELTAYYCEHVIEHGIEALQMLIDRGVERGDFRRTGLREFPQLLVAPALMAVIWRGLFERHRHLDTERMLATHIDLVLTALRAPGANGAKEGAKE